MLRLIIDQVVFGVLGLDPGRPGTMAIHFFLYDSVKILLLLVVMISVVGFLRTFIPPDRMKGWLSRRGGLGHLLAALFGAVTPFCSCSSIPIFLGLLKSGLSLGVTFSFLIASPLINEYLVVLMLGFFGWRITVLYVASGILIAVAVGLVLGRMGLESELVADLQDPAVLPGGALVAGGLGSRARYGLQEAWSIVRKIWVWVLVGVGLGAVIHNYVPETLVQAVISRTGIWSVPLATALGVPMYGSCAAIVPIAVVLFQKGIPLGTALAFMMATSALSLPEAVILRRAMRLKLIAIFFGVTTLAIVLTGYLFNILQRVLA